MHAEDTDPPAAVRLDVWLDIACLFKTRSEAQKACTAGRVAVNGQPAKSNRPLRPGDRIVINRPLGRKQMITVNGLADRHIAKADARALYTDTTPQPTPEEIEMRRMERIFHASTTPLHTPEKRERRALRKLKGKI